MSRTQSQNISEICLSQKGGNRLPEITQLLTSWANGNQAALAQLIPLVFDARAMKQVAQTFQFAFSATFETVRKLPAE